MAGGTGSGFETPGGSGVQAPAASTSRGGAGSGFEVPGGGVSSAPPSGGGGFFHSIGHAITAPAHWTATKLEKGAADAKQIGTGIYDIGKQVVDPGNGGSWGHVGDEYKALFTGHIGRMLHLAQETPAGRGDTAAISSLTKGQYESAKGVVEHPLRDPVMDLLWLAPAGHIVAKGGLSALGKGALLDAPRMLSEPGRRPVSLFTSKNAGRRVVQAGIDKAVNHALANEHPSGLLGHEGPVANYGRSRMGGTLAEIGRARIRYRQAMIASTRIAGRQVGKFAKSLGQEVENPQLVAQALLHSLHDNQLPEHEAIFHEHQAAKGVNPEQNTAWAQAFNDAAKLGVVHLGQDDRLVVDEGHPLATPLARADSALEKIGAYGEEQLIARGLRDPSDLADRNARVSQLVQRGAPLRGAEPQVLSDARRGLIKAEAKHEKNLQAEAKWREGNGQKTLNGDRVSPGPNLTQGGKPVEDTPEVSNPHRNNVVLSGQKLEDARARVQQLEDKYGISSPERRAAIEKGISAREQLHEAAHSLFGDQASEHLAHIEGLARQYARANDVTPHEFYAHHLSSVEAPTTVDGAENALHSSERDIPGLTPKEVTEYLSLANRDTPMGASEWERLLELDGKVKAAKPPREAQPPSDAGDRVLGSYAPQEGVVQLSSEHAKPETILHESLHALRQSLSPTVGEIASRLYTHDGEWTREAEEHFVNDMMKAHSGEHVEPEVERLYRMTSSYLPGRGYVPMTVWEDAKQSHSPMASSVGSVIGEAKNPINTHFASGEATAQGLRRTDVAESVTAHWQKLMRFFNTLDHRELSAQHGGDTRLSSSDALVRYDRRTEAGFKLPAGKVGPVIKEALDVLENKTGLPAPEEEGLSAGVSEALKELVGHIFPRLGTDPELLRIEKTAPVGARAPAGYKWVPERIVKLKDLEAAITRGDPMALGRFMDNVNGAVTAATVYYKFGHVFTRVFTNAATNIMQGSLRPTEMAHSWDVFHKLTEEEQQEALAYAGTHYYEAAPGAQGGTLVGKSMQKGLHIPFTDKALRTRSGVGVMSPQWWAHNVDAPFRFNSIAFEARKAGYEGAEGFRQFLHDVRDYNGLDDAKRAEVDGVLRRADREAIAYDRLNQFEKRFLSRAVWFYPWIKGSTVFTANTILEHPFKAAFLGSLGQQGNEETSGFLGDMPSYADGLTLLTRGQEPVVTDLNTFNPASTAGDLLRIPEHLSDLGGMLNPALGAGVGIAESVNPYGARTPNPIWDNVKGLVSSAPEYQIGAAALDHGDQSHRLYPGGHGLSPLYKNWLGELVRAFGSPASPRHVNPESGHSLAERERTGR